MFKSEEGNVMPGPEERRRIMERAGVVLAHARSLVRDLDAMDHGSIAVGPLQPPGYLPADFPVLYAPRGSIFHSPSLTPESRAHFR